METFNIFNCRVLLGLSTTEAGQLVHSTKRTWENWESGASPIPPAKLELFIKKITFEKSDDYRQLIVIVDERNQIPRDVISNENFCGLVENDDGSYTIKSLAIDRITKRPYVHKTKFQELYNETSLSIAQQWISVVD